MFAITVSAIAKIKNKVATRENTIQTAQMIATKHETLAPIDGQRTVIKDAGMSAKEEYSIVMIAPVSMSWIGSAPKAIVISTSHASMIATNTPNNTRLKMSGESLVLITCQGYQMEVVKSSGCIVGECHLTPKCTRNG